MKRVKVSENFYLDEFMHPTIYRSLGGGSLKLIDERIITIIQELRVDIKAPIYINNWFNGNPVYSGSLKIPNKYINSGLRLAKGIGATYSQHRYGRAVDIKVKGFTPKEVQEFILKNEDKYRKLGLSRLEDADYTKTWNHLDCAFTKSDNIQIFKP